MSAVVAEPGRPLVACYARHDEDDALRYRVSGGPGEIAEWHPERVLRFGGLTTYAQVHPRGSELHLFTRVDDTKWSYCRSPDWAATWDAPRVFLALDTDQEVYMPTTLAADGRTLRVAVSGHPKEYERKPLHDVWACLVDLASGEVRLPSDPTVVANLRDGTGLPLNYEKLELVHQTPADRTVNIFDVADGPVFEVGFVSKMRDDSSTTDARYHVSSLRHGRWLTEELTPAGTTFGYIHAGCYVGGLAFPHRSPGGQVYLTREAGGVWHLERWDRTDRGWTPRPLVQPGTTRLARPWALSIPADGLDVVALAIERYGEEYLNTLSHLIGAGLAGPYRPAA